MTFTGLDTISLTPSQFVKITVLLERKSYLSAFPLLAVMKPIQCSPASVIQSRLSLSEYWEATSRLRQIRVFPNTVRTATSKRGSYVSLLTIGMTSWREREREREREERDNQLATYIVMTLFWTRSTLFCTFDKIIFEVFYLFSWSTEAYNLKPIEEAKISKKTPWQGRSAKEQTTRTYWRLGVLHRSALHAIERHEVDLSGQLLFVHVFEDGCRREVTVHNDVEQSGTRKSQKTQNHNHDLTSHKLVLATCFGSVGEFGHNDVFFFFDENSAEE